MDGGKNEECYGAGASPSDILMGHIEPAAVRALLLLGGRTVWGACWEAAAALVPRLAWQRSLHLGAVGVNCAAPTYCRRCGAGGDGLAALRFSALLSCAAPHTP